MTFSGFAAVAAAGALVDKTSAFAAAPSARIAFRTVHFDYVTKIGSQVLGNNSILCPLDF